MRTPTILLILLSLCLAIEARPAHAAKPTTEQLKAAARAAGSVNGLCPVTSRLVVPAAGTTTYKGEKIAFSEKAGVAQFNADPTRYMDRLRLNPPKYWYTSRKASVADMRKAKGAFKCANGGCPLTDKVIVARGGTVDYRGQKIGFCCPGCRGRFQKNPEKYMRALRADPLAFAYDRPGPTSTQMRVARRNCGTNNGRCPVMGRLVVEKGGSSTYGAERVGFCCPPCALKFKKDPETYMQRMRSEPAAYGYVPAGAVVSERKADECQASDTR